MNDQHQPTPSSSAKPADDLKALPSLEETKAAVQAAIDSITSGATTIVPSAVWETATNADQGTCPKPYDTGDGRTAFLPNRFAENLTVSEDQWTQIEATAKSAAAKLGATDVQVMKNAPNNHDIGFYGAAGLFVKVSYGGNLVVAGYTGCRLPADQK